MKYSDGGLANVPMSISQGDARPSPNYVIKNHGCQSSIEPYRCLRYTRALQSPYPVCHRIYSSLSEMVYINANLLRGFVEEIVGHHARLPLDRRTLQLCCPGWNSQQYVYIIKLLNHFSKCWIILTFRFIINRHIKHS